jgi:hypothetical protein
MGTTDVDGLCVAALCEAVMRAVVASGAVTSENVGRAVEVIRAEVKEMLTGKTYAADRVEFMNHRLSEKTMVTMVVASCIFVLKD